jgi:hypothetical protein
MIINQQYADWKLKEDSSASVTIVDNLTDYSLEYDFNEFCDVIFGNDRQMAHFYLNRQDTLYNLIDDKEFEELSKRFSNSISIKQTLDIDKFSVSHKLQFIDKKWIDKKFHIKNYKQHERAWNSFYKLRPNSYGFFEISKIEYSERYGLLYFTHKARPQIGNGKLIILKKVDNSWITYGQVTLWYY